MRIRWLLAALDSLCCAPRAGLGQPRPSDADPEEQVSPSFALPDPANSRPSASWPVPQPPPPHPPGSSGESTPPLFAGESVIAPLSPAPQDAPPQISPHVEPWRYLRQDGVTWYYQPSGHWSYWSAGRWVEYSPSRYANMPPLRPPLAQIPRRLRVSRRILGPNYVPPNAAPYGPSAYPPGYGGPAGGVGPGVGIGAGVY